MARSKKKVLERMQRVERPDKEEAYVLKEKLEPITLGAKNVLETEHLKIGYTIEHPIKRTHFANTTRTKNRCSWSEWSGKEYIFQNDSWRTASNFRKIRDWEWNYDRIF